MKNIKSKAPKGKVENFTRPAFSRTADCRQPNS